MKSFPICLVDLAFFLPFIFSAEATVERLKCYQCEVRDSSLCTNDYLQTCPDNQSYDRCMTRVYKTKDDGAWIHKSCALAPCTFRDASQASGLGFDHCDRSQNEYDCVSCCKENGCNTGGSSSCFPTGFAVLSLVLLSCLRGRFRHN